MVGEREKEERKIQRKKTGFTVIHFLTCTETIVKYRAKIRSPR